MAKKNKILDCHSVKKGKFTVNWVFYILHAVYLVTYIFKSLTNVKHPAYPGSTIHCLDWCWPQG